MRLADLRLDARATRANANRGKHTLGAHFVLVILILSAVPLFAGDVDAAAPSIQHAKLLAGDGAADDYFGYSVSLSGDTALISSLLDDDQGIDGGSAYVYVRSGTTWTQQAKLVAADGAEGDHFGTSVSLNGDTALIGSALDDDQGHNSGSAYVYVRSGTTWTQQAKLVPADGAENDQFGYSVSLSGDTALVGSYGDDAPEFDSGSAYVYVRGGTTWTEQAKLVAADGAESDFFGLSVSLSGDTALIGSVYDDDQGIDGGSAYVYVRGGTTWTEQAKLVAADGAEGDHFGYSVALSGDTTLIGSPADDDQGIDGGSAYVYVRSATTWTEQAKLVAADGAEGDEFGFSVSLSGNTALIGSVLDDGQVDADGSAYVYVRSGTTWTQEAKLVAAEGAASDIFGFSVSLSGDTALVGSLFDDDQGTNSGSAYIFVSEAPPSAPLDLAAVAGPGAGQITLTWAAPANDGKTPVTNYRVHRGTASGGGSFLIQVGNGTTYTDNGVPNGATRFYQVSAVNAAGESPLGNEASATAFAPPSAPLDLEASAGPGAGQITLTWEAPANDGGTPVTNYRVHRGTASGAETFLVNAGNALSYTDATCSSRFTCYYKVSAVNVVGEGPLSNEAFTATRILVHEENVTLTPSTPLPPAGVGAVTVYDSGPHVCVDVTPSGGARQNVACVNRILLGPADPLVSRGNVSLAAGDLGTGPHTTLSVDVRYTYDPGQLFEAGSVLGGVTAPHTPFAPTPEGVDWWLTHGEEVPLTVTVTLFQDGVPQRSETHAIPWLGQALAAAQATPPP